MKFKLDENFGTRTKSLFKIEDTMFKLFVVRKYRAVPMNIFMKSAVVKNTVW